MRTQVVGYNVLADRIDSRPVAWVRILIGLACIFRGLEAWRVLDRVLAPDTLRLPYVPWAVAPSLELVPAYVAAWLLAAAAFAAGWHTRLAGALLCALMAYTLVIDQQTYSNHLYLLTLAVFLLTLADSGRSVSIDARGRRSETIAAWPITLMKLQVSIVYAFSAVSKINLLYLSGVVIFLNLRPSLKSLLADHSATPHVMMAAAVSSIVFELWLAGALWSPRWRSRAVSVGVLFHVGLALSLTSEVSVQLAVFALLMMSLYVLFFDHAAHPLTVYFDSSCGICNTAINWFLSHDRRSLIAAVGTPGRRVFGDETSNSILVIDQRTGEYLTRTRAFAKMVRVLPAPYQLLRLLSLPGFVRVSDAGYRLIARNRDRISEAVGIGYCVRAR